MRIGEVNRDNYQQMLSLLGVKNNAVLDNLIGNDKKNYTEEELYELQLQRGIITKDTIFVKEGDNSWKKTVSVPDDVKNDIISTVRRQFLENGNGMSKDGGVDGMEVLGMIEKYKKSIPRDERLSATWTLERMMIGEQQRLVNYVKDNVSGWTQGQPFDRDILLKSNFGENRVDVKV